MNKNEIIAEAKAECVQHDLEVFKDEVKGKLGKIAFANDKIEKMKALIVAIKEELEAMEYKGADFT